MREITNYIAWEVAVMRTLTLAVWYKDFFSMKRSIDHLSSKELKDECP